LFTHKCYAGVGVKVIGSGSGFEILEDDQRLRIIDRRTAGWYTAGFVLALLTFIPTVLGIVLTAQALASGASHWPVGLAISAAGCVFGLGLLFIVRRVRALAAVPAADVPPTLIIDLGDRALLDSGGRRLASLDEASFGRKMQLGSSSPALAVTFAGKTIVFARGNPFAGGLGNIEDPLRRHGLMG
jgi:hypothetical protein